MSAFKYSGGSAVTYLGAVMLKTVLGFINTGTPQILGSGRDGASVLVPTGSGLQLSTMLLDAHSIYLYVQTPYAGGASDYILCQLKATVNLNIRSTDTNGYAYAGCGAAGPINDSGIKALVTQNYQDWHAASFTTSPSSQHIYYVFPAAWGVPVLKISGGTVACHTPYFIDVTTSGVTRQVCVLESTGTYTGAGTPVTIDSSAL
jgi:hypothetical protein